MRVFMAMCAALWLTGCASVADAGRLAEVEVVSRASGQKLETWRHGGRLYVAGTPGERYSVRLVNRSSTRVLTVLSVDGVNAVAGEERGGTARHRSRQAATILRATRISVAPARVRLKC